MLKEKKNLILIICAIVVPIIAIIIISIVMIYLSQHPRVEIVNIDDFVGNNIRSKEKELQVEEILYNISKLNRENTGRHEKAKIREGTFSQTFEKEINYVSFIVDIENLHESFSVKYTWSENKEIKINEWDTNVLCPKDDQIAYDDFNCTDFWKKTYGTNDPIIFKLPYRKVNQYQISYNTESEKIIVAIVGCRTDTIIPHKEAADKWLKENIKNLDDYKIEYTYCN